MSTKPPRPKLDTTGNTDITDVLNTILASLPDGSVFLIPVGNYRLDGTALLDRKTGVTIEAAHGAQFFASTPGDRYRQHWRVQNCTRTTLRGVKQKGANPDGGYHKDANGNDLAQHGFCVAGSVGTLLDGCAATDTYGDAVCITETGNNTARVWSEATTVANLSCDRIGRQGVSFPASNGAVVYGGSYHNIARTIFDIEPSLPDCGALDIAITNIDDITNDGIGSLLNVVAKGRVGGITALNLHVRSGPGSITSNAAPGATWGPITVDGIVVDQPSNHPPAFTFRNTNGLTVRNCRWPFYGKQAPDAAAIRLLNCTDWTVDDESNDFPGVPNLVTYA